MCLIVKLCELRDLYVTCIQWSQLCNMDTLGPLSSLVLVCAHVCLCLHACVYILSVFVSVHMCGHGYMLMYVCMYMCGVICDCRFIHLCLHSCMCVLIAIYYCTVVKYNVTGPASHFICRQILLLGIIAY